MAATIQCENFVGNAWKKDLCLNCFKSKEEHKFKSVEIPQIPATLPDPPKEGILKGAKTLNLNKTNKVIFHNNECEVIGFGGDDVYSEDEDYPDSTNNETTDDDDDEYENEEDRAFQKLTKSNTDYNSVPENLQEPKEGEVKKIIEPLKLGKGVLDDKGKKTTLLVSVTPFGGRSPVKNKINVNGFSNAQKPEEKTDKESVINDEKQTTKIAQAEDAANKIKRSQPLDKNSKVRLLRDCENNENAQDDVKKDKKASEKVSNLIDKAKKKVNQLPVISDSQNLLFKSNKKMAATDKNKPVLLDIYQLKEDEVVKANNEKNEEKTMKSILLSPEMRNKFLSSELKITSSMIEVRKDGNTAIRKDPATALSASVTNATPKKDAAASTGKDVTATKLVPNVSSLYRQYKNSRDETAVPETPPEPLNTSVSIVPTMIFNTEDPKLDVDPKIKVETFVPDAIILTDKVEESEDGKEITAENYEKVIEGEEITLFSAEKPKQVGDELEPEISRESAGEPDGRADSDDLSEPPELPLKPPPIMDARACFLHDLTNPGDSVKILTEKPKVPAKPIIIQSKKTNFQSPIHTNRPKSPSMEKFLDVTSSPQVSVKNHPPLQESPSADSVKSQKRPAPKPPSPKEEPSERAIKVAEAEDKEEEKQKTEEEKLIKDRGEPIRRISRSTENLLELMTDSHESNDSGSVQVPEPVPRRSLSLSQDSLLSSGIEEVQSKKKSTRGRFSLRKLLHLGKHKDSSKDSTNTTGRHRNPLPPAPKPKLEIIHPIDLNGARIEVVPPLRSVKSRRTSSSASSSSGEQRESDVLSDSSTSHSVNSSGNDSHGTMEKSKKPPPPPRAQSLDTWNNKPARPPPPKSADILRHGNTTWNSPIVPETKSDNLYVNLGEVRSGLAPNKPVRTGSLRETNLENSKRLAVSSQPEDSGYESFDVSLCTVQSVESSLPADDNVYECVQISRQRSSSPECDSAIPDSPNPSYNKMKRCSNSRNRRSDGSVDLSQDYFKMKFMRSLSLPYCASETESEIYSPYSFYGSELGEDDYEWSPTSGRMLRTSRLKLKKGRSIVHKNLEDNYGAVIVANHEALAQVVEQMHQGPVAPPPLRALTTAVNLRWTDFAIAKDATGVVVERRIFYPAHWGVHSVTLSLMAEKGLNSSLHAKGPFNLNPLTELNDLIPASYLPMLKKDESELIQASISVLTRLQIETVESYGKNMRSGPLSDESKKEVNFVLLQVINALKSLQAQGIEEAPKKLTNLIVCREERDPHPRICITHSFERSDESSKRSLCQCVMNAITEILPPTELTNLISDILHKEKAVSLSQAKAILEFTLWGPADIAFGNSTRERELALQRWLDLERATVLQGLIRTRAELTVFEEWHLLFLVRTNAKMLAEASTLLEFGNLTETIGSS